MRNLLIIDDNPSSCIQILGELEEFYHVKIESNPNKVLEESLWKGFDIFLIDIHLPGMKGDRLIKYIKEEQKRESVFLLITADTPDKAIEDYYSSFSDDFIHKEISPRELLKRVEIAVERKNLISSRISYKRININLLETEIKIDGNLLDLTLLEYKILVLLLKKNCCGNYILKEIFITSIWKNTTIESKTVNTHIGNLNKKIADYNYRIRVDRIKGVTLDELSS